MDDQAENDTEIEMNEWRRENGSKNRPIRDMMPFDWFDNLHFILNKIDWFYYDQKIQTICLYRIVFLSVCSSKIYSEKNIPKQKHRTNSYPMFECSQNASSWLKMMEVWQNYLFIESIRKNELSFRNSVLLTKRMLAMAIVQIQRKFMFSYRNI